MITTLERDEVSGYRVGRCGDWYIRARPDGGSFDLAKPPFQGWEETKSEFLGVSIEQTARLLGVPKGELYDWGKQ